MQTSAWGFPGELDLDQVRRALREGDSHRGLLDPGDTLEVEGGAHQIPFAAHLRGAAQREATESAATTIPSSLVAACAL